MTLEAQASEPRRILNVAVIGVGEVAMVTHLPTLSLCSDMFRTVALVDISQDALEHCSRKFHVPHTFDSVDKMLEQVPSVDLVMIMNANEYHAIHAIKSLEAGKHVFIEKPMTLSHEDGAAIERARVAANRVVFVGYMRRYATAFLRVKEEMRALKKGDINYVRVRDIIGYNHYFVNQSGTFPKQFSDFPEAAKVERQALSQSVHSQALGGKASNKRDIMSWGLLTGLASHDLSAMRELIGMPQKVLAATRNADGMFITVLFQFDGFCCYYEMGIGPIRQFDAHIEIYSKQRHFKVNYDTPYVKGLPITATISGSRLNGDHVEENIRPTYEDAYTLEYRELYGAIVHGQDVKTDPLDADQDMKIFDMVMEKIVDLE